VSPRMPVLEADGELRRPRAKGSRGVQPPVELGAITRNLPLTRAVSQIPYQGLLGGEGRLIRLYKEAQAICEGRWVLLERVERELVEEGDQPEGLLPGSVQLYKRAHAVCEEIWQFLERTEATIAEEGDRVERLLDEFVARPGARERWEATRGRSTPATE